MCNCIPGNGRATDPDPCSTPSYPAIAEPDRVLSGQLLVKMPQITIEILVPIALRHPLQHRPGHRLRRRLPSSPVKPPAKPALLVTFPPPPMCRSDAHDLRGLKPGNLLRHCLQHHFLCLHSPAPSRSSSRIPCSAWSPNSRGPQNGHIVCYLNRTYRVLTTISVHALDNDWLGSYNWHSMWLTANSLD